MAASFVSGVERVSSSDGKTCTEEASLIDSSCHELEAYRSMIQFGRSRTMKTLSQILGEQTDSAADRGRLSITCFDDSGEPEINIIHRSSELQTYFSTDRSMRRHNGGSDGLPSRERRIFVLEDLPRTFVELLGCHLRINPLFFARHCADLSFLESFEDLPKERKDINQFFMPFMHFVNAPKLLRKPDRDLAELYAPNFLVRRILAWPKPHGGWDLRGSIGEMECCVSYWGVAYEDGRWDALILVDPSLQNKLFFIDQPTYRQSQTRSSPLRIQLNGDMECTHFQSSNQIPNDPHLWRDVKDIRDTRPIFDQLLDIYGSKAYDPGKKPFECTVPLRKFALHEWVDFLNHAVHCLVLTKGEPYLDNTHFSSPISALWAPRTEEWLLGRLVKWSRRLHMEHTIISTFMRSVGIDLHDHSHLVSNIDITEVRQWCHVRDKLLEYKSLYDDTAASYIQVMSLRESQTSNDQAKSLGQITLIASLFVPVSLVSGVFSMGGGFAPGGDRFWVFFVVVVPIIVFVWASFFTRFGPWAKRIIVASLAAMKQAPPILPVYGPMN